MWKLLATSVEAAGLTLSSVESHVPMVIQPFVDTENIATPMSCVLLLRPAPQNRLQPRLEERVVTVRSEMEFVLTNQCVVVNGATVERGQNGVETGDAFVGTTRPLLQGRGLLT